MKNRELIAELGKFDGEADAQIYIQAENLGQNYDDEGYYYHDVRSVDPIVGLGDSIIVVGAFRTGGSRGAAG